LFIYQVIFDKLIYVAVFTTLVQVFPYLMSSHLYL